MNEVKLAELAEEQDEKRKALLKALSVDAQDLEGLSESDIGALLEKIQGTLSESALSLTS